MSDHYSLSDYAGDPHLRAAITEKYPAIAPHITGHRASDYGPNHVAAVDQIVASQIQPTGEGEHFPSGSGYLAWLDDTIRIERPHLGFPDDAKWWAWQSGLTEVSYHGIVPKYGVVEFLARQIGGPRSKGREGGFSHPPAAGGPEVVIFSGHMPAELQSPPRYSPLFEDCGEDELRYREECERFDAETVVKWASFVVLPGETPLEVVERIARLHIKPHRYFGQKCIFSGPLAPKPYGDHDRLSKAGKKANHAPSHPSHKLAVFRRGATFWAIPVCDDCLYGELDRRGGRTGGGLVDEMAGHGERAVIVDYYTDHSAWHSGACDECGRER